MHGRKRVKCKKCHRVKLHFGQGMCSACLRQTKRRTKPSFYLGTCYSEIKRRCTTPDRHPSRSYYGLPFCSKKEFLTRFVDDHKFLKLFQLWREHHYKRGFAPSIDRIDNTKGYTLDNLQFIVHSQNGSKDWSKPVKLIYNNGSVVQFRSQKIAADFIGISPAYLCKELQEKEVFLTPWFQIIRGSK